MRWILLISLLPFLAAAARQDAVPSKFPSEPGTFKSTTPKQPRLKAGGRPLVPAIDMPVADPDANFRVTDTIDGKKVSTGPIRVFAFDEVGRGSKLGEINAGTVVQLKAVRNVNGTLFYAIPYEGKIAWINGFFLAPAK